MKLRGAICLLFVLILTAMCSFNSFSAQINDGVITGDVRSALLMDATTGTVIWEFNADDAHEPASVTKTMTLLLIFEALDSGKIKIDDTVSVSENAAGMGGSQVYLEVGETMTVNEMIKCVAVASANDAAVALAEFVAGSESAFVGLMNSRAEELGMNSTHFENTTGLDDNVTNHVTSARDIAIMSRELLKHEAIFNYTTIWMDTIRNGEFGLTNTNRLIRFYRGANGLKTGSTSKAGFCISATAKQDNLQLIAVIMGAPTRDERNSTAVRMLDYGFANYSLYTMPKTKTDDIIISGGVSPGIMTSNVGFCTLTTKGADKKITCEIDIPEKMSAPVNKGDIVGKASYYLNGEKVGESDIIAETGTPRISFWGILSRIIKKYLII